MFKFIIIITFASLQNGICYNSSNILTKEINLYHNQTATKAEYAYQVVNKTLNAFKQWFYTLTFCEFDYFENRILKYTESYGYGYPVMLLNGCPELNNSTKTKPKIGKHGQTAYLVTSNDLTIEGSEEVVKALEKTGIFKPRSTVIFVISTPVKVDSYFSYAMKNHFQLLYSRSITNSVLVLWSDNLQIHTYNPFSNELKDITNVKDITKLLERQYYNLCGFVLHLSVFKKPYLTDVGSINCDSSLILTVMNEFNATCKPLPPRDGNTVGDLLENGTATGVTADLMDGYTDLELNSRILKNSYFGYIDTTYPLIQDELCFIIKKSVRQSTFKTTLKLISKNMLILFIFNVFFLITVGLVVFKIETKIWYDKRTSGDTILDILKCLIRQTVDVKYIGPIFRIVMLMIMIYSLVVDCAIDGIITSAISYPRYKRDINNISKLLNTNLTFGIHNRDFLIFNNSLSPEQYDKFKDRIMIVNDEKIKDIIEKRRFEYAILLRKSEAEYITSKQANVINGRPLYHIVLDCPVPCTIVYGLKFGSPFLYRLEYILHHLNQGGILQYWIRSDEFKLQRTNSKKLFSGDSKERKPLSIESFKEFFLVWMIGLAISAIIFIIEIIQANINIYINIKRKWKTKK